MKKFKNIGISLSEEIYVTLDIEEMESEIVEGHGYHEVGGGWEITITAIFIDAFGVEKDVTKSYSESELRKVEKYLGDYHLGDILDTANDNPLTL